MDVEGVMDGAKRAIDGCWRVFHEGYWIKAYDVPADSLRAKKGLIAALTRRLFKAVELQALGIEIKSSDPLMRLCGDHLEEALALGRLVLHRSGEEGIDELWGEPFKAFAFPIEDFYRSRYMKIAATMRQIDRLCDTLAATFAGVPMFAGVEPLIASFATAARVKCETLHT